jgi:hypothetical protein
MINFESFKVGFYRQVPQVAMAAEYLVNLYNQILPQVQGGGKLEIEAFFGKNIDGKFNNNLTPNIAQVIEDMLGKCTVWKQQQDWHIYYDYYTGNQQRIRVGDPQDVTSINKIKLAYVDLSYGEPNPLWELTNYLTRVTLKLEQPTAAAAAAAADHELVHFNQVKLSMRKSYEIASGNCSGVSWRYELIKYWVAPTMQELESIVKLEPPVLSMECEIINSTDTPLSENNKYILFAALLMKMEDFLVVPIYQMNQTQPAVSLPSFIVQPQK